MIFRFLFRLEYKSIQNNVYRYYQYLEKNSNSNRVNILIKLFILLNAYFSFFDSFGLVFQ